MIAENLLSIAAKNKSAIQKIALLFFPLFLIFTQPTHAYTQAWLPYQPIKHNAANQTSSNKSSSNAIGAGISFGAKETGITLNVSASRGKGNSDGHDTTYNNTQINAGNKLTLKSGGDTNLIGATAKGKQISANIGGDLNIQSVQDTSTYQSKQESASGNATVGVGTVASASGNLNQISINGDYASVTEQSGLMAGDGGFQIAVKGNTDLKGGVIASTDKAVANNSNTFTTATLTQSDLTNVATYDAQSLSVGVSTNGVAPPMALNAKDKDSSITRSGISGANVSITNDAKQKQLTGKDSADTIATLNQDVSTDKDTSGAINNNLNVQEIQTGFAVTQAFVQQANTFVATKAAESTAARKAIDDELNKPEGQRNQAVIDQATQTLQDNAAWAPGGNYRQVLTAITAASSGNVTGGTNQLIQGAAVNYIQSLGAEQIKAMAPALGGEGSPAHTALHGILACSGAAAQGADCGTAALGASTGVVINTLLGGDPSTMTAQEKEDRKNLVATLVTGIAAAAGSTEVSSATNAAVIETENNYLSPKQHDEKQKQLANCKSIAECNAVKEKWNVVDQQQTKEAITVLANGKGDSVMAPTESDLKQVRAELQSACAVFCTADKQASLNELNGYFLPNGEVNRDALRTGNINMVELTKAGIGLAGSVAGTATGVILTVTGAALVAAPEPTGVSKPAGVATATVGAATLTDAAYGLYSNSVNLYRATQGSVVYLPGSGLEWLAADVAPGNQTAQDIAKMGSLGLAFAGGRVYVGTVPMYGDSAMSQYAPATINGMLDANAVTSQGVRSGLFIPNTLPGTSAATWWLDRTQILQLGQTAHEYTLRVLQVNTPNPGANQ